MMVIIMGMVMFTLWDVNANRGHFTGPVFSFLHRVFS